MTHNVTLSNEELVGQAYQIAEDYDLAGGQLGALGNLAAAFTR